MHTCQLEAGKALFRRRNSLQSLQQGTIDLHGLHIAEATSCLYELLPLYQQLGQRQVKIITGSGHHNVQGRARLLPAVQECLQEMGFHFKTVKDTNGFVGALLVSLPLWTR